MTRETLFCYDFAMFRTRLTQPIKSIKTKLDEMIVTLAILVRIQRFWSRLIDNFKKLNFMIYIKQNHELFHQKKH